MALYLLGIFMGAIDTGIITPARTRPGPRRFQGGLNAGFRDLYILFAGACALTLGVLLLVGRGPHHPAAPPTATVPDDAA